MVYPGFPENQPSWSGRSDREMIEEYEKQRAAQNASDLANKGFDESNWLDFAKQKAAEGDEAWMEKYWNYLSSEQSAKTANDLAVEWDSTKYQRLVEDLKKAGLSPYAINGVSPGSLSPVSRSHSGSEITSRANNKATADKSTLKAVLQLIGVGLGALIYALV